ncbi:MAG: hypothetical protein AB7V77_03225, partial [Candidatus Woesearchaeota archaeon]
MSDETTKPEEDVNIPEEENTAEDSSKSEDAIEKIKKAAEERIKENLNPESRKEEIKDWGEKERKQTEKENAEIEKRNKKEAEALRKQTEKEIKNSKSNSGSDSTNDILKKLFGKDEKQTEITSASKLITFLVVFLLTFLGPLILNILDGTNRILLYIVLFFIAICVTFVFADLINKGQFIAILICIFFNLYLNQLFNDAINGLVSGNTILIVKIMFITIIYALIAFQAGWVGKHIAITIIMIIGLLMALFFILGLLLNPAFRESLKMKFTADESEGVNIWTNFKSYIEYQFKLGKGDIVSGAEQENTHQFIGVEVLGAAAINKEIREGNDVITQIYYKTGSYRELSI